MGDQVTGHISFNTATGLYFADPGENIYWDATTPNTTAVELSHNGSAIASWTKLGSGLQVTNRPPGGADQLLFSSAYDDGASRGGFNLTLTDPTGTALSSAAVPTSLQGFQSVQGSMLFAYFKNDDDGQPLAQLYADGMLTSLRQISAVPEPDTYAMLLGGFAMLALLARRRATNPSKPSPANSIA
ncbi:PEP-CTERM sorting domain-containing protein [Duganella sp. S19_KUP01_CR8]|uniref:PEP-CTERM sorting domain-containing protein n=1 Tax=Duganella sp. S19_KUP01_CR8 TaxID=3025502 RepID=UPI002FCDA22B